MPQAPHSLFHADPCLSWTLLGQEPPGPPAAFPVPAGPWWHWMTLKVPSSLDGSGIPGQGVKLWVPHTKDTHRCQPVPSAGSFPSVQSPGGCPHAPSSAVIPSCPRWPGSRGDPELIQQQLQALLPPAEPMLELSQGPSCAPLAPSTELLSPTGAGH